MLGLFLAAALAGLGGAFALTVAAGPSPAAQMAKAADAFLTGLDDQQRKQATFTFDDKGRETWHYVPMTRTGVMWKTLSAAQRKLAESLLRSALSATGHDKVKLIMTLESVLAELEKDPVKRDPEKYHLSIFGKPDARGPWSWRFEGHHVSLNFTVVDGTLIATSPAFLGANPAEVREGKRKGTRALGVEEDLGRQLLKSFSPEQRKRILFEAAAPPEIITGAESKVGPLEEVGITVAQMNEKQKALLDKVIAAYTSMMTPALASERLARLEKAGKDKIRFAWAGGSERGDPHYYRLQGPTFLVEYDNTQNGANHAHTVWRDFKGDFGRDLLAEHYKRAHGR